MNYRRMITMFTLAAFLPLAIGCSTSTVRVVELNSDPESRAQLQDGEALTIVGYTRASDGYRDWNGVVRVDSPDSLRFTSERGDTTFVLPRAEVAAVSTLPPSEPMTLRQRETALTVGIVVAAIGAGVAVYAAQN